MAEENIGAEQRRELVEAAERVMAEWARNANDKRWDVQKSQMNQLIGVCGEALCAEEIANYLRYQSSRERPSWGSAVVAGVLEALKPVLDAVPRERDRERVTLWRYYAVYLARAYTYQNASKPRTGGDHRERVR